MSQSLTFSAGLLSLVIFAVFVAVWQIATSSTGGGGLPAGMDPEYAKLMGIQATQGKSAMPSPGDVGAKIGSTCATRSTFAGPMKGNRHPARIFDRARGARLSARRGGRGPARLPHRHVAADLRALDPFIQIMKPVSPLAWMPLALTRSAIHRSRRFSSSSSVPCGRADQYGVRRGDCPQGMAQRGAYAGSRACPARLHRDPASRGAHDSDRHADLDRYRWLVIVAAEMLVGGTGIGYFVWNEWNNLSITNVIVAILFIGVVGMILDLILARAAKAVSYPE